MKVIRGPFVLFLLPGFVLTAARSGSGQQVGQGPQVTCIGQACGGPGPFPYVYRVKPNGLPISSIEVGVEDDELAHYTLLGAPAGWEMSIVAVARAHDVGPTQHDGTTGSAGTCPFVLRFDKGASGAAQTSLFSVAYSYDQPMRGFHDVNWKAGSTQSSWTFPVGASKGPVHSPIRMNALLIVLDDVGTSHLSLFDDADHVCHDTHPFAFTPQLDLLASAGIRFTSFYVNPVCSTTRACLQTGRYAFRNGMGQLSNLESPFSLDDCEVTIAELLEAGLPAGQGYTSGAFGKWHLNPGAGTEDATHAVRNGYDRFFGHLANTGHHYDWFKIEHDAEWLDPVGISVTGQWSAEVVRKDASSWINSTTKPFFAYVCFNPPHAPFLQPPPVETSDATPRRLLSMGTEQALVAALPFELEDAPLIYRAMIEGVDSEIGCLLEDIGEKRANTMVFVVSDNGTPQNGLPDHPVDRGKGTVYELGVRVPMIVHGPLVTQPGECSALVGAVDLWRTIGAIAGASDVLNTCPGGNDAIDSVSFLPLIQNPGLAGTRTLAFSQLFWPNGAHDGATFDCLAKHSRAITDGDYKYIRTLHEDGDTCPQCSSSPGTEVPCTYVHELYRISLDPDESFNYFEHGWTQGASSAHATLSSAMDALSEF